MFYRFVLCVCILCGGFTWVLSICATERKYDKWGRGVGGGVLEIMNKLHLSASICHWGLHVCKHVGPRPNGNEWPPRWKWEVLVLRGE